MNPTSTKLTDKVAAFKLIARDALRMTLIAPRLTKIANLEAEIKANVDGKADLEHKILVRKYELSKEDVNHPDFQEKKVYAETIIAEFTKHLDCLAKELTDLNELVKEQQKGIAKIESGETKVSIDELKSLVADMISESAIAAAKL